jgi:hypothetical protein
MMDSTERDRVFIARLAAQGPWLYVPKMMTTACDWFKMELTQSGLFMAHCSFRS